MDPHGSPQFPQGPLLHSPDSPFIRHSQECRDFIPRHRLLLPPHEVPQHQDQQLCLAQVPRGVSHQPAELRWGEWSAIEYRSSRQRLRNAAAARGRFEPFR